MKKLIVCLLVILSFALNAATISNYGTERIRANYGSKVTFKNGNGFLWAEIKGQAVTTASPIVVYLDNIAGYSAIDFYGMQASTGSTPTTLSAQALTSAGANSGAAQTLTSGTDLTDLKSPFYKLTLSTTVNRTVTFNVLVHD